MLHRAVQLLALVGPLHRRRPNLATDGRQLAHKNSHTILLVQNLTQPPLRQDPATLQPQPDTTHHVAVDAEAPRPRLREQQRVHHGPQDPLTPQAAHEVSRSVPQEVLHPRLRQNLPRSLLEEVGDPHWEIKREGLHKAPPTVCTRRLLMPARPTIDQPLGRPYRLVVLVGLVNRLLDATPVMVAGTALKPRSDRQLMEHLIRHKVRRNFLRVAAEAGTHAFLQPSQQSGEPHHILPHGLPRRVAQPSVLADTPEQVDICLVIVPLQTVDGLLLRSCYPRPPTLDSTTKGKLRAVEPNAKRLLVDI